MVEGNDAHIQTAQRLLKGIPIDAKNMVEEKGVIILAVLIMLLERPVCARDMVVERGAFILDVRRVR